MIEALEPAPRIAASRLLDLFRDYGVSSVVDPLMGVPTHLANLKRWGIAVHGGETLEWCVRVGQGIIRNDTTVLREDEIAELIEPYPGRLYSAENFRPWEGVFFTGEQATYLTIWRENVAQLRSDGQIGLAILGLWSVLCYWMQKAEAPDAMPDIPADQLAFEYLTATSRYVTVNSKRNTVRRGRASETLAAVDPVDALYVAVPVRRRLRKRDPRIWIWEAWWKRDPSLTGELSAREDLFDAGMADDAAHDAALRTLIIGADRIPLIIAQTTPADAEHVERIATETGRTVETRYAAEDEAYVIARR